MFFLLPPLPPLLPWFAFSNGLSDGTLPPSRMVLDVAVRRWVMMSCGFNVRKIIGGGGVEGCFSPKGHWYHENRFIVGYRCRASRLCMKSLGLRRRVGHLRWLHQRFMSSLWQRTRWQSRTRPDGHALAKPTRVMLIILFTPDCYYNVHTLGVLRAISLSWRVVQGLVPRRNRLTTLYHKSTHR